MTERAERLARLARGWDGAADGYEAYFVPRFAPWLAETLAAVTDQPLPDGPILVPCCGTFPELPALLTHFPDREIHGIDLSAGMVSRARRRAARLAGEDSVADRPRVTVVEGDASTLDPRWLGRCAAVVSVFGLQQLPEPEHAIRSWTAALRPGGRLSVTYWPENTEETGPFALMAELIRARVPATGSSWEYGLVPVITAEGADVVRDERVPHPVHHADAASFLDAYTRSGPLRALADSRGDAFVDRLRAEFLDRAPVGELTHHPRARLLVARRGAGGR